jgi:uncharacterized protein DUF3309
MNLLWLIVIVLVVLALVGAPSVGPWHHGYGWYPSGGIGVVLLVLVIVLLIR